METLSLKPPNFTWSRVGVRPAGAGKKSKLGIWGVWECTVITRMWSQTSIPLVGEVRDLGAGQVQASGHWSPNA